jgi:NAD(P)-dependent dehydrogenase (short-subunit alcohol dehydrogenase family)
MGDRLRGKVAIVIGAGSVIGPPDRPPIGNGRAAAMVYAREGAAVMAMDMNEEAAEETRRMIEEEGGTCSAFQGDISRAQDCRAMAEQCRKTYGRIDILHNNVGMGIPKPGGILEVDEENWDLIMNVNLKGMFLSCQAVLPQMIEQGGGSILNISSVGAVRHGVHALMVYSVSKAGVNALTRCLASEMAEKNIRVNGIMIGLIDSPLVYKEIAELYEGDLERMRSDRSERVPMKRMGEPWDVAYASLFLVSDEAKYITGQILTVDGGITVR